MFEGFERTDFMTALRSWDEFNKKVKCIYMQELYEFGTDSIWRKDFKVNGGMILDGMWFVEK